MASYRLMPMLADSSGTLSLRPVFAKLPPDRSIRAQRVAIYEHGRKWPHAGAAATTRLPGPQGIASAASRCAS